MNRPAGNSRNDILEAAAVCFRENGFSATSIDDVARSLSATKGKIYHHFRSKTDLFFAVYRRAMDINFEAIDGAAAHHADPNRRLQDMAMAHALTMMRRQPFERVLAQGVALHQQGSTTAAQRETLRQLIELRDNYELRFRSAIEQACENADQTLDDASLASKSFLAVLNSTVFWYRPRESDKPAEQESIARSLVKFAMQGLNLEPGDDATDRPNRMGDDDE